MWPSIQKYLGWVGNHAQIDHRRWVVVDVESTGLDTGKDRLISIAAVALRVQEQSGQAPRLSIDLADSFEATLQHQQDLRSAPRATEERHWGRCVSPNQDEPGSRLDRPSASIKNNVLLHGIGLAEQAQGMAPTQALQAFAAYLDGAPLLGYHSWFDQTMLERAFQIHCGRPFDAAWLDVEDLARGAHRELRRLSLDTWLQRYGIACELRHNAAADSMATAELLLRLWSRVRQAPGSPWQIVNRVAADVRFLGPFG